MNRDSNKSSTVLKAFRVLEAVADSAAHPSAAELSRQLEMDRVTVYRMLRTLEAAGYLGAQTADAAPADSGEIVAARIIELMRATHMPNGLGGVGFSGEDASALAQSAIRQRRAIGNAPRETNQDDIETIYERAVSYW